MPRLKQVYDGEWIQPVMRGYLMQCCDCGLVHKVNFKVKRSGRRNSVLFQAFRIAKRK